jgi:hypothetical protein
MPPKVLLKNPLGITDALLAELEKVFPDQAPRKELSSFELGVLVGHQMVSDYLKHLKDKE